MILTAMPLPAQNFENAVAGEVGKTELALVRVNDLMAKGDAFQADGDQRRAFTHFRAAFEAVPQGPSGEVFRQQAKDRYAAATIAYAEELVSINRGREARMIVEETLEDQRVPNHAGLREMLSRLDDPEWISPAKETPKHDREVSTVKRLLGEAEALLAKDAFDEATNKYSEVLNIDSYNEAARDGLVKASQRSRSYRDAAYDASRAKLLDEVMEKWAYDNPDTGRRRSSPSGAPDLGAMQDAPQSEDIANRLATIMVPQVNLQGTTIDTAVRYLEAVSREYDPTGQGINFVLAAGDGIDRSRPITLVMNSVPLLALVQYMTEFVGAKFRIDQFAVHIVPEVEEDDTMVQRAFLVRPDFFTMGATGSGGGGDDPFGEESRVQVVSEQEYLQNQGVTFPDGANAQYLPLANKLIVYNTRSNLDLIASLVNASALDSPKQVVIKVTTMDIRQENLEELTFDTLLGVLDVEQGNDVLFGGGSLQAPVDVGTAQAGYLPSGADFPFVDTTTGQVLGGDRVSGGLRSGQQAIGVDGLERVIGVDRETALSSAAAPGILSVLGQLTDPQFQIVMRGVSQHKNSDLITAPHVTVKPGHRARIESGVDFIYPVEYDPPELPQEVTVLSGGGVFPVTPAHPTQFETRKLGFNLEVEPVISPDGKMVDLALAPEFVEFLGFVNYGSPITAAGTDLLGNPTNIEVTDNQILQPVFSTIRESVQVSIYDGATLVIGGLTEDLRTMVNDKVPIVGDLPVVGRLFRGKLERARHRAVVVFVTVKIIDSQGARVNQQVLSAPVAPDDALFAP